MSAAINELIARYNQLGALKARVETELAAVEAGLRVAGVLPPRRGRPPIPQTLTEAQAREFHRRHQAGERSLEVIEGEREYQRLIKRRQREAARLAS